MRKFDINHLIQFHPEVVSFLMWSLVVLLVMAVALFFYTRRQVALRAMEKKARYAQKGQPSKRGRSGRKR